jgi:hypothetical protein
MVVAVVQLALVVGLLLLLFLLNCWEIGADA